MKSLLVLSMLNRRPNVDGLFENLSDGFDLTYRKLDLRGLKSLVRVFKGLDFSSYDGVVLDLSHRLLRNHVKEISEINVPVFIYEEDACQNFMPDSRWHGDFFNFYQKLPDVRVITTGFDISQKLCSLGVDAFFLPKGFDASLIYFDQRHEKRDIDFAFIGTMGSDAYFERRRMLQYVQALTNLSLLRTSPGKEYFETLAKVKIFFSADCGIGEYMAKNFEAMASGCLLLAYDQGGTEEAGLGLVDGENVLLYKNFEEACEKYNWSLNNFEESEKIRLKGVSHVRARNSFSMLSKTLSNYMLDLI